MSDQGRDRVAEVVARVVEGTRWLQPPLVIDATVRALDAAGLLLTEERRGRWTRIVGEARRSLYMRGAQQIVVDGCDALLRELAGEGSGEALSPACVCPNAPCALHPNPATPPEPARPRRMAGNPHAKPPHHVEHDEIETCADDPPCQPAAGAGADYTDAPITPTELAHEHGDWIPVMWEIDPGYKRVTRLLCGRGDCNETREVKHAG